MCIGLVHSIIAEVEISEDKYGPCFCLLSTWKEENLAVVASRTKHAYIFRIYDVLTERGESV
jgi:hypothetical protein